MRFSHSFPSAGSPRSARPKPVFRPRIGAPSGVQCDRPSFKGRLPAQYSPSTDSALDPGPGEFDRISLSK